IRSAVAAGADLQSVPGMGVPPLHFVLGSMPRSTSSQRRLVETLLELGADPNAPGHEPAIQVVLDRFTQDEGEVIDLLELLTAHGADVNAKGRESLSVGRTPLHVASAKDWPAVARYLLSKGADPRAVDAAGHTARQALEALDGMRNPFATAESEATNAAMIAF